LNLIPFLAQTTRPTTGMRPEVLWIGMFLFIGLYLYLMVRSNKREQRKKKDLLAGIKKNDRVMTIGGIIGTVVSVKENEVVLKVDETTNTKMTFRRGAIQQKLADDEKPEEPK
jgi:preprotein translocase subunit YajC